MACATCFSVPSHPFPHVASISIPPGPCPRRMLEIAKEKHREMATHLIDQRFSDSPTNQKTPLASARDLNACGSPFLSYGSMLWCWSYLAGFWVFAKSLGDKSNESCTWELAYHLFTHLLGPCAFAQSSSIIPSVCQTRTRDERQIETTTVTPNKLYHALPSPTLMTSNLQQACFAEGTGFVFSLCCHECKLL